MTQARKTAISAEHDPDSNDLFEQGRRKRQQNSADTMEMFSMIERHYLPIAQEKLPDPMSWPPRIYQGTSISEDDPDLGRVVFKFQLIEVRAIDGSLTSKHWELRRTMYANSGGLKAAYARIIKEKADAEKKEQAKKKIERAKGAKKEPVDTEPSDPVE